MSEVSDTSRVAIILADFANVDASGKLNMLGGGVTVTGIDANTGQTAPLTAVLNCHVDPKFIGQEFALELALYSLDDGQLVQPPVGGPPVRVGQPVTVTGPQLPNGAYVPPGSIWTGAQLIVSFQNGLPLAAGKAYEWRASVDGNVVCVAALAVAGPHPVTIG